MNTISYPAVIEGDGKDGSYGVFFPDLPGCTSGGETYEQAAINAHEALTGHIGLMIKDSDPLPEPTPINKLKIDDDIVVADIIPIIIDQPDDIKGDVESFTIFLSPDVIAKLLHLSQEKGMSLNQIICMAIEDFMNKN